MTHLHSLAISGFRAFAGNEEFSLDADTILVVGANGQGKTSFFDALLWTITGRVPRLGSPQSVVSLYSPSGEARVALQLKKRDGTILTVVRRSDGKATSLTVENGGETVRGTHAESELLDQLWPEALSATEPLDALSSALERGVYLQQDVLTAFLSADTDHERFTAISELVGAGRVTELQNALERSRAAWSRVTNTRAAEAAELEERFSSLEHQLRGMSTTPDAVEPSAWEQWWRDAQEAGLSGVDPPASDSVQAANALDAAVTQLQALQLSLQRRLDVGRVLLAELDAMPEPSSADREALRRAAEQASNDLMRSRERLSAAEEQAADVRRMQIELTEQRQQLRVFAELALRHLGEACPVCEQAYDREATTRRLEAILDDPDSRPTSMPDVAAVAAEVQLKERVASTAVQELREAERAHQDWLARQEQLARRLAEFHTDAEGARDRGGQLRRTLGTLEEQSRRLSGLRSEGEALSLTLARAGQQARRAEVEREVVELQSQLESMQRDVSARQETGKLASTIIEALRDAGSELVDDQLHRLEPLLQRIYATADPHPSFRVAKLLSRMRQGRGRVLPAVADPVYELESDAPLAVLSSSQMNVLAVSVFLALNLGIPALPLRTAILDDPLQSLDDLNLLGLIDLLRRIREQRQTLISTHDARLATLLERKLRPVRPGQRTLVIELKGWGREGPNVVQREVQPDERPVRIVA